MTTNDDDLNAEPARSAALLGAIVGELRRLAFPHVEQLNQLIDGVLTMIEERDDQIVDLWDKLRTERAEHDREMREAGRDLREMEQDLAREHAKAEGYY